ncbi:hypothetical protein BO70DRAFT_40600 [Aspergillus heteromorphus CBS 117.55]|uniref:Uncharacterized protein n=1 Tax=Aspergillus heteromorphus CBS 117.55 TaxID=1448321 RepID=A0A317W809_9EURO|nr:uncharacterized protein BO70DRAFT_40600 [Aspergillus heteromorphus CBS 117.55]PWY81841.1 hypothetical protein BO70DRAFT_40600 [Aspergillus heteromorphus CBS 117.55]
MNPSNSTPIHPFHPAQITFPTFTTLLAHYPATVEARARRKATDKILRPRGKKQSKAPASAPAPDRSEPTPAQRAQIQAEVDEILDLDAFRYEVLPGRVRERERADYGEEGGHGHGYLEKEELVKLVQWKMKHGIFRPALLGLIRSNPDSLVKTATARAFTLLASEAKDSDSSFPTQSLDALIKPLRGVGVATASLVLGLSGRVPFYSDDVYLWVCLGEWRSEGGIDGDGVVEERVRKGVYKRGNGELDVKYNLGEYRGLWEGGWGLRGRLGEVQWTEVERVALVVRYGDENEKEEQSKKGGKRKQDDTTPTTTTARRRSKRLQR